MKPRIKISLAVGVIGLILGICVSTFGRISWGPIVFLLIGSTASFIAVRREKPNTKQDGARAGAVTGSIAGILVTLGQFIGALIILLAPPTAAEIATPGLSTQIGYAVGQATNTSICIGFPLALVIGACIGYLITSKPTEPTTNSAKI